MIISGIADEAGSGILSQIKAHKDLGWNHIELRLINGKNIASEVSERDFMHIKQVIEDSEMVVTGFASAIGNWSRHIDGDFSIDINELQVAVKRMKLLNVKYIRIMSWIGEGVISLYWRDKSIQRLKELVKIAEDNNIILLHENCTGWGGLSAKNMLELESAINSPSFKLLYDIGNVISHGYDPKVFFETIRGKFAYLHVKDARKNPIGGKSSDYTYCGEGDAMLKEILNKILKEDKYDGIVSIEPHVASIVHLSSSKEVSAEDKYKSYIKYGETFTKLLDEL